MVCHVRVQGPLYGEVDILDCLRVGYAPFQQVHAATADADT